MKSIITTALTTAFNLVISLQKVTASLNPAPNHNYYGLKTALKDLGYTDYQIKEFFSIEDRDILKTSLVVLGLSNMGLDVRAYDEMEGESFGVTKIPTLTDLEKKVLTGIYHGDEYEEMATEGFENLLDYTELTSSSLKGVLSSLQKKDMIIIGEFPSGKSAYHLDNDFYSYVGDLYSGEFTLTPFEKAQNIITKYVDTNTEREMIYIDDYNHKLGVTINQLKNLFNEGSGDLQQIARYFFYSGKLFVESRMDVGFNDCFILGKTPHPTSRATVDELEEFLMTIDAI